jgi:dTDP-4-dehydrorhamnose reductase
MNQKKTILIFGVSSFLGSNLAEILKKKYRVVGTYFENQTRIEGVLSLKCDVHNKEMVQKITYIVKPDITIYAIGLSSLQDCHNHPKVADALNTAGVFYASAAAERYQSKFIYFSSSYIFSGEDTLYSENDTPMPSSMYGSNMASSEFFIQKSCLNYLIFRCSPIIGRSYNHNDSTWTEVLDRHNYLNKKIVCDTKVHTGFIDVWSVASILEEAIDQNITNRLFQLSSTDIMNRYEFSKKYLEIVKGNQSLLSKGDWRFPKLDNQAKRQNTNEENFYRMDISNARSTFKTKLPTIEESIKNTNKSYSGAIGSSTIKATGVTFI